MPGGRKPLDAETKRQHRQLSSAVYEAKNAGKRREAAKSACAAMTNADYHTRREYRAQVAEHSENYRRRKLEEELVDRRSAGAVKRQARKVEAEHLRASHQSAAKSSPRPQPKPSCKRLPVARRASSSQEMSRHLSPLSKRDGTSDDGAGEDSDAPARPAPNPTNHSSPPASLHELRSTFVSKPLSQCLHHIKVMISHLFCSLMALPYFPPSPGLLLCEPIYAPDPGHEDRFSHNVFFAIIHEDWMGVVTSDNTIVRMLNAYPKARTFRATTWSRFEELWNLDCTEYHEHPNAVPTPASKMPSPRKKGELPTEDARNRELVVKANIQRNLGRTRPPAVPIDAARADAMFTPSWDPKQPHHRCLLWPVGSRRQVAQSPPMQPRLPLSRRERVAVITALNHESPSTADLADAIAAMAIGESTPGISPDRNCPSATGLAMPGRPLRFCMRERAVAILKATPGAALAFSSDEDELLHFLEEEDNELPTLAEVDDDEIPALASG
ncbi:hypothetical protein K438DRAFT_1985491 [Mycena galopus ATCC 62051]|nr:hypothetical protein K438DRAFT_1985491 [Mycena galopus ATCC 62051]